MSKVKRFVAGLGKRLVLALVALLLVFFLDVVLLGDDRKRVRHDV
jgi:hypothetical protein